jgi:nucleotide sugar dehydrogenase
MTADYRASLLGGASIGVWGVGHIGYSTICHFAERGVRVLGYDVDPERVSLVNRGESPVAEIADWLGIAAGTLVERGLIRATTDWRELSPEQAPVQFICVPTELGGRPSLSALNDVTDKLAHLVAEQHSTATPATVPLVILESTVPPNAIDHHVVPLLKSAGLELGRDVLLGCAPRRDWFGAPARTLRSLPRVFGGTNPSTTRAMHDVLAIICESLVAAPDHRHAEAVKSFENAYRQVEITLANQLSMAYPDLDVRRILELVGTKWNVGTFRPSFGIGGYCIPLASHYVLEGATHPEQLSLLETTIESSTAQAPRVAELVARRGDIRSVGILGLSYSANTRIWALSPTLQLASVFREHGLTVRVNDPNFTCAEIERIVGVESFSFPAGLRQMDAVLLVTGHLAYEPDGRCASSGALLDHLTSCRLVLDNAGIWRELPLAAHGIEYHVAGDRHWLSAPVERNGSALRPERG